jgi:signal transduction histidine kinase
MPEQMILELEAKLASALSALRRAEERAITGHLALEVMHEIRNPLEALGNLTYLASVEADQPEKVRQFMLLADEQIEMLSHIASQTLGLGKLSSAPRMVDLATLTEAALRIHRHTLEVKKVKLVADLPGNVKAPVYTGEMLQVVSNLIVNALDALPVDGTLHLRLRKAHGEAHLVVADNGHGIPKEHTASIFEPFFTTREESGTGLGLALSKKIVERHRGRIRLRSSVRPGKSGTIFKVSIPAS